MKRRALLLACVMLALVALAWINISKQTSVLLVLSEETARTDQRHNEPADRAATTTQSVSPTRSPAESTTLEPPQISAQTQEIPAAAPPPPPLIPDTTLYAYGLEQTVNLICIINSQEFVTATGAIISSSGYILTNAHIIDRASGNVECSVRRGSPAKAFATADLVFLPKGYQSASTEEEKARYDFSVWKMREPGPYPFWAIDFETPFSEQEVLRTQSYPAELLGGDTIMKSLSLVFSNTAVTATDTYIVKSTSNLSAQHGSSGGILIDPHTARVRALIFAVGPGNAISERDLYSLAPKTLEETTKQETGESFKERFTR